MQCIRPVCHPVSCAWTAAVSGFSRRGLRTRATVSGAKPGRKPRAAANATSKSVAADDGPLPPLALRPLRDIALLCGRNTSGTKAVLRADLANVIGVPGRKPDSKAGDVTRLLSIDMGVRNLAYCVLKIDEQKHSAPELVAWERLALVGDGAEAIDKDDQSAASSSVGPFSPPAMAAVAARLIHDRLLPLAPSHIIIERQRFRSGGAAAVLEWTVRVNSLESMLHGILAYSLIDKAQRARHSIQTVQAVSPRQVVQFLLRGGISQALPASFSLPARATKEKDIKAVKEAFVANALMSAANKTRELIGYSSKKGNQVHAMAEAFLARWNAKQKKTRAKAKAGDKSKLVLSKIDDLADCVTQGLVWLEWERNKNTLREQGAEVLLEEKDLPEQK